MTNTQLLLTVGIPSILVILSWLSNNSRLGRLEKALDDMGGRVGSIEGDLRQFYSVTGTLQGRMDEMSRRP